MTLWITVGVTDGDAAGALGTVGIYFSDWNRYGGIVRPENDPPTRTFCFIVNGWTYFRSQMLTVLMDMSRCAMLSRAGDARRSSLLAQPGRNTRR